MPLGGWGGGGGGVKGPRSNNMPQAPRNVNPALDLTSTDLAAIILANQNLQILVTKLNFA